MELKILILVGILLIFIICINLNKNTEKFDVLKKYKFYTRSDVCDESINYTLGGGNFCNKMVDLDDYNELSSLLIDDVCDLETSKIITNSNIKFLGDNTSVSQLSVSFWIYVSEDPSEEIFIFKAKDGDVSDTFVNRFTISIDENKQIRFNFYGKQIMTYDGQIKLNKYSHIAFTYNTKVMKIYVNSQLYRQVYSKKSSIDLSNTEITLNPDENLDTTTIQILKLRYFPMEITKKYIKTYLINEMPDYQFENCTEIYQKYGPYKQLVLETNTEKNLANIISDPEYVINAWYGSENYIRKGYGTDVTEMVKVFIRNNATITVNDSTFDYSSNPVASETGSNLYLLIKSSDFPVTSNIVQKSGEFCKSLTPFNNSKVFENFSTKIQMMNSDNTSVYDPILNYNNIENRYNNLSFDVVNNIVYMKGSIQTTDNNTTVGYFPYGTTIPRNYYFSVWTHGMALGYVSIGTDYKIKLFKHRKRKTSTVYLANVSFPLSSGINLAYIAQQETQFVKLYIEGSKKRIAISELEIYDINNSNITVYAKFTSSSSMSKYPTSNLSNGDTSGSTIFMTKIEDNPYLLVNLGGLYNISSIKIYNDIKMISGSTSNIAGLKVSLLNQSKEEMASNTWDATEYTDSNELTEGEDGICQSWDAQSPNAHTYVNPKTVSGQFDTVVNNYAITDLNGNILEESGAVDSGTDFSITCDSGIESINYNSANALGTTQTKKWILLLRQTAGQYGSKTFWSTNFGEEDDDNFSRVADFEDYREDGKFHLKIKWPLEDEDVEWKQTSNPLTVGAGVVTGYEAVNVDISTTAGWGGLEYSSSNMTLFDGTPNSGNWWYAVGTRRKFGIGVPGHTTSHKRVELWVYASDPDNSLEYSNKGSIGNVTCNDGTVYASVYGEYETDNILEYQNVEANNYGQDVKGEYDGGVEDGNKLWCYVDNPTSRWQYVTIGSHSSVEANQKIYYDFKVFSFNVESRLVSTLFEDFDSTNKAQYFMDDEYGIAHLNGLMKYKGSVKNLMRTNAVIDTLPEELRPKKQKVFNVVIPKLNYSIIMRLNIFVTGEMILSSGLSQKNAKLAISNGICLDGVRYTTTEKTNDLVLNDGYKPYSGSTNSTEKTLLSSEYSIVQSTEVEDFDCSSDFSVSFFINPETLPGTIFNFGNGEGILKILETGQVKFIHGSNEASDSAMATEGIEEIEFSTTLTVGKMTYVCVVRDMTAKTISLYINTLLKETKAISLEYVARCASFTKVISPDTELGYPGLNGTLKNLRFYSAIFSQTDINNLYTSKFIDNIQYDVPSIEKIGNLVILSGVIYLDSPTTSVIGELGDESYYPEFDLKFTVNVSNTSARQIIIGRNGMITLLQRSSGLNFLSLDGIIYYTE